MNEAKKNAIGGGAGKKEKKKSPSLCCESRYLTFNFKQCHNNKNNTTTSLLIPMKSKRHVYNSQYQTHFLAYIYIYIHSKSD